MCCVLLRKKRMSLCSPDKVFTITNRLPFNIKEIFSVIYGHSIYSHDFNRFTVINNQIMSVTVFISI